MSHFREGRQPHPDASLSADEGRDDRVRLAHSTVPGRSIHAADHDEDAAESEVMESSPLPAPEPSLPARSAVHHAGIARRAQPEQSQGQSQGQSATYELSGAALSGLTRRDAYASTDGQAKSSSRAGDGHICGESCVEHGAAYATTKEEKHSCGADCAQHAKGAARSEATAGKGGEPADAKSDKGDKGDKPDAGGKDSKGGAKKADSKELPKGKERLADDAKDPKAQEGEEDESGSEAKSEKPSEKQVNEAKAASPSASPGSAAGAAKADKKDAHSGTQVTAPSAAARPEVRPREASGSARAEVTAGPPGEGFPRVLGVTKWAISGIPPRDQYDVKSQANDSVTVVLKPTTAPEMTVSATSTQVGKYPIAETKTVKNGKKSETLKVVIEVNATVAETVQQFEQEHVSDYQLAHTITYKAVETAINAMAGKEFTGTSENEAKQKGWAAIKETLPSKLRTDLDGLHDILVAVCNASVTERDEKGSHTWDLLEQKPDFKNKQLVKTVVYGDVTAPGPASSDIIKLDK